MTYITYFHGLMERHETLRAWPPVGPGSAKDSLGPARTWSDINVGSDRACPKPIANPTSGVGVHAVAREAFSGFGKVGFGQNMASADGKDVVILMRQRL